MTGVIIGVLFAACGIGIHFIVKDAFSRDESGRYKLRRGIYRSLLSIEGMGSMLWFSAFRHNEKQQPPPGYELGNWIN